MDNGGQPLSPEQEIQYREYVWGKFKNNLNARERADWLRVAGRFQHWREIGNQFRDGLAVTNNLTKERGWEKEVYFPLRKDAKALRDGWTIEWHLRDLTLVHRDVLAKMHELAREHPDRFTFREVPALETERAFEIGQDIARAMEQGKTRETAEREAVEREQSKQRDQAVGREIEKLRSALDRTPDLETRGRLLNVLEGAAVLHPGKEITQLALAQLQAEHQVMREQAQQRVALGQHPENLEPARTEPELGISDKPLPPLEFDSAERRTALAMHLAELGVEPELIEIRMLCELAQAQPYSVVSSTCLAQPNSLAPGKFRCQAVFVVRSGALELPVVHAAFERVPLGAGEDQRASVGVLAVPHADVAALEPGHFHARVFACATAALEPFRLGQVERVVGSGLLDVHSAYSFATCRSRFLLAISSNAMRWKLSWVRWYSCTSIGFSRYMSPR